MEVSSRLLCYSGQVKTMCWLFDSANLWATLRKMAAGGIAVSPKDVVLRGVYVQPGGNEQHLKMINLVGCGFQVLRMVAGETMREKIHMVCHRDAN